MTETDDPLAGAGPMPEPYKDETGKVYGRLTVLGRHYIKRDNINMRRRAIFKCQCACGIKISVSGNMLRRGTFRECGACSQAWSQK